MRMKNDRELKDLTKERGELQLINRNIDDEKNGRSTKLTYNT